MKHATDRIALHLCWVCAAALIFGYGIAVARYKLFPFRAIVLAEAGCRKLCSPKPSNNCVFTRLARTPLRAAIHRTPQACDGLNLVTRMGVGGRLSVDVFDMDGVAVHRWDIDWFNIWPDAKHVPASEMPQAPPGTHVHGAILLKNGNLVFNFEHLGMVCLDFDGNVVWRLPYRTHHSISRSDNGNLLVCGQIDHTKPCDRIPNWKPPFTEPTVLEVTPDGKIAHEWSIVDLLRNNGREGLLYLGSHNNGTTVVTGDILHLNDVDLFPARLKEGFFKKGDIMVSLRNINTVFVFNRKDEKIKFVCTGSFVRQHDPDFIDGNTFSVFDNHNVNTDLRRSQSRIVIVSAPSQTIRTFYEGTLEHPFYTEIMGKHQWLPNGNLLITESCYGRAFEIDRNGRTVWEYTNYINKGVVTLVEEVTRLPSTYVSLFSGPKQSGQALRAPKESSETSVVLNPVEIER